MNTYFVKYDTTEGRKCIVEHSLSSAFRVAKMADDKDFKGITITCEQMQKTDKCRHAVATLVWEQTYPQGERRELNLRFVHGKGYVPIEEWERDMSQNVLD